MVLFVLYNTSNAFGLDVSFAQKINNVWQPVPNGGSITLYCELNYIIDEYIGVKNNTSGPLCLWMSKSYAQKQSTPFKDLFCWDKCYDMGVTKSDACLKYNSQEIRYIDLHISYNPLGKAGETIIKYTFWATGSVGDSSFIIVHLVSLPLGVEMTGQLPDLSLCPNPCDGKAVVTAGNAGWEEARIYISDMAGRRLMAVDIPKGQTETRADLSALREGMYLYYSEINGVIGKTHKLIIKK